LPRAGWFWLVACSSAQARTRACPYWPSWQQCSDLLRRNHMGVLSRMHAPDVYGRRPAIAGAAGLGDPVVRPARRGRPVGARRTGGWVVARKARRTAMASAGTTGAARLPYWRGTCATAGPAAVQSYGPLLEVGNRHWAWYA